MRPCRDTFAGGIGSHITHSELQALFDVIGTPSWADAEAVTTPAWRHYLQVHMWLSHRTCWLPAAAGIVLLAHGYC
jgi:hypothetical protein